VQMAYPNTAARTGRVFGATPSRVRISYPPPLPRSKKPQVRAWFHPSKGNAKAGAAPSQEPPRNFFVSVSFQFVEI
jgi:hypothetical protein